MNIHKRLSIVVTLCAVTMSAGCATAGTGKTQTGDNNHKSNLDSSTRANHNSLLDPSFYQSNHQIPS